MKSGLSMDVLLKELDSRLKKGVEPWTIISLLKLKDKGQFEAAYSSFMGGEVKALQGNWIEAIRAKLKSFLNAKHSNWMVENSITEEDINWKPDTPNPKPSVVPPPVDNNKSKAKRLYAQIVSAQEDLNNAINDPEAIKLPEGDYVDQVEKLVQGFVDYADGITNKASVEEKDLTELESILSGFHEYTRLLLNPSTSPKVYNRALNQMQEKFNKVRPKGPTKPVKDPADVVKFLVDQIRGYHRSVHDCLKGNEARIEKSDRLEIMKIANDCLNRALEIQAGTSITAENIEELRQLADGLMEYHTKLNELLRLGAGKLSSADLASLKVLPIAQRFDPPPPPPKPSSPFKAPPPPPSKRSPIEEKEFNDLKIDLKTMVRELNARIRNIEDKMPGRSAWARGKQQNSIDKIQETVDELRAIAVQLDDEHLSLADAKELMENAQNSFKTVKKEEIYKGYIPQQYKKAQEAASKPSAGPKEKAELAKWGKANKVYQVELKKYNIKLDEINKQQNSLDVLEDELAEMKKPKITPLPQPPADVIAQKEKEIEDKRLKLRLQREDAATMLIALTKSYGGYDTELSNTTSMRFYRGGSFGFETRVLPRSSVEKLGLLNESDNAMITQIEDSYVLRARLSSNEVVVSTKEYAGGNKVVIVQEPGIVRDASPALDPTKLTEAQYKEMVEEKAMQMALMFAFSYQQGKPAIIRGGDPEIRKRAHAILLVMKYASQDGSMDSTMKYMFGKTLAGGLKSLGNTLSGKQMSDIDLSGLQVYSNEGPQQYGKNTLGQNMLDRLKRAHHSVDYAQMRKDKDFIRQVMPDLSTNELFQKQKDEFLKIREERRDKSSNQSEVLGVDAPSKGLKK